MRAQLVPFIFLILLVGGALLGYIFYNVYYGTRYEYSVSERYVIDVLRNEIERLKGYSKQSLIYSSHQALREHACLGGQVGAKEWICNGPNIYPPEDSKECLEKYTLYYINVYLGNYSILDMPIQLTKKNFTSCEYGVDPDEVINPPGIYDDFYDEGNFWVNITDAIASVTGGNAAVNNNISIDEFITRNRFWYLWRIFYEWANDDVYTPCVCNRLGCACPSTSGEEACTTCEDDSEYCGDLALDDLQKRFNKTEVECYRTDPYICCAQGRGTICGYPCGCQGWDNSICISDCEHKCVEPPPLGPLCPVDMNNIINNPSTNIAPYKTSLYISPNPLLTNFLDNNLEDIDDYCLCHYEARFASSHQYTCIDNKYHVPSDKGPVPLIFRVSAIAFLRDPCRCCTTCSCPGCGC
jgi:hypothetical protein